ncbi:MAG: phosphoribosyltransferase [Candidatus Methanoperedens sp.]|nr:phosphoribosyltransferase [Candidatus Methanoperedens sp.]
MESSIKCYKLSWGAANRLARALAHKVIESGYEPDIIIGIARGGLVPARMVCDLLLKNNLISVTTQHWGIATNLGKAWIKFSLPQEADISGKRVLVVDDVADTGDSISILMDYLQKKNPLEIRSAVLHYKTCSTLIPDYYSEKLEEWNWIIYPWAFYEDLAGFVEKLLDNQLTDDELRTGLMGSFNIMISRIEIRKILNDLYKLGKLRKIKKDKKTLWEKVKT